LMAWHRADPVDQKELDRNEAVYSRQGNRNPFIDLPQLAEYLWGDKAGQTFRIDGNPTEGDAILLTPSEGSTIDFGEVAIGRSVTLSLQIKGENLSAPITVKISDEGTKQAQYFTSTVTSIPAVTANTPEGYALQIKYAPKKMGSHTCKITLSGGGLPRAYTCALTGGCLATPSLSTIHATEASDVTSDSFTANWDAPEGETIDYYLVTLTAADGTSSQTISDENQCRFENLPNGYKYSYYVQSHRLGYVSQPSNIITVDCSSVTGISTDRELSVHSGDGEIIFYTGAPHTGCRIYTVQGILVKSIPQIENYQTVRLPAGIYIVTTDNMTTPIKVVVK
ncbi:MAG: endonuclease, partial [Muribaculaceae bacterium]|nr:endonuclease [Muribaculaceae bacterium]